MRTPKYILSILCIFSGVLVHGQTQLETYINQGLESNLALQQKIANYEQSLYKLKGARGLFFPNIGIDARYTVADGGRIIEFPVGDMLNPVYSTLNGLNQLNGMVNSATGQAVYFINPETGEPLDFPTLENMEFPFYRPQEHETKISLVQPVFNPQILYNYQINKEQTRVEQVDVDRYKRELIKEIKTAYYNYQKAQHMLILVNETEELLEENMRVSESLFRNQKVTSEVVYRSKAEFDKLQAQKAEAEKAEQMSRAYFNFLLNRPLHENISTPDANPVVQAVPVEDSDSTALTVEKREELLILDHYQYMSAKKLAVNRAASIPTLTLAANYGFQGEEYSFTSDDDFVLASVVLRWNLFQGMKNRAEVQEARVAMHQLELKEAEVKKQLNLEIMNAQYSLEAAIKAVEAAEAQVLSLEKAFQVVEKKYENGQAPLIEYTDARTAMTTGKQNLVVALFEAKIKEAEYERATASFPITSIEN